MTFQFWLGRLSELVKVAGVLVISTPEDCAKLRALGFCARAVTALTLLCSRQADLMISITNFSRVRYDEASMSFMVTLVGKGFRMRLIICSPLTIWR